MAARPPVCDIGAPAPDFTLPATDERATALAEVCGPRDQTPSMGCSIKGRDS